MIYLFLYPISTIPGIRRNPRAPARSVMATLSLSHDTDERQQHSRMLKMTSQLEGHEEESQVAGGGGRGDTLKCGTWLKAGRLLMLEAAWKLPCSLELRA